ncbi:DUF1993 family protein [Microbulbifer sp. SSSA005]|uniref:DUF1993 family protein n=1 Tax=Microbulbifer sp. SSSA005 TaxID=3243378 RepID=UPI004039056C
MNLTDLLLPTYIQLLEALSSWLEKAKTEFPEDESEALLKARLAPDMFPLSSQVRFREPLNNSKPILVIFTYPSRLR